MAGYNTVKTNKELHIIAYLRCPNVHPNPYFLILQYGTNLVCKNNIIHFEKKKHLALVKNILVIGKLLKLTTLIIMNKQVYKDTQML